MTFAVPTKRNTSYGLDPNSFSSPPKNNTVVKCKESPRLGAKTKIFSKKTRSKSLSKESSPLPAASKMVRSFSQVTPPTLYADKGQLKMDTLKKSLVSSHSLFRSKQHHCRAPLPLPSQDIPDDDDIVYSYAITDHDFLEETYKFLKKQDSGICECGLIMAEAELPNGWAVHMSQEVSSKDVVFFQRGDQTTWDVPEEILSYLKQDQINFILKLCRHKPCRIPPSLSNFIRAEFVKNSVSISLGLKGA